MAVQEQLGLRLGPRKSTADVTVTGQNLEDPAWSIPADLFTEVFLKPLDLHRFLETLTRLMDRRCGHRRFLRDNLA